MTPGLALFYAGMVRRKNVLNTIMSVVFLLRTGNGDVVYGGIFPAFGPDFGGFGVIGDLSNVFFRGISGIGARPLCG